MAVIHISKLSLRLLFIAWLWLGIAQAQQQPERFGFGTPASSEDIAAVDIDIKPDGTALPPGSDVFKRSPRS